MPPRQSLIHQQNLWKTFFVFLLPLIATNILQNLSGTINTIFVGQMMGVDAIAAVSVFFPILFLLLAFIIGISTGTTVLVGQAWGAQNIEKVQSVVGSTLFMTIIGGIITAIIGVFFAHDILELLGTDPKVMHLSLPYVQWMLAGSPLLFVYIIYSQTTLLFIQDSKKTRNNSSTESINHSLRLRLTHAHICSIGFKSGLYAGSQRILCPCCSNNS